MIRIDPSSPRGIVWLASYPKSGNTWVRAFIHALYHSIVGDPPAEIDINNMDDLFRTDRDPVLYEKFTKCPVLTVDPEDLARVRPEVQTFLAETINSPLLVKTHNAHIADRGFPLINDSVSIGAVYLIRSPLDVATSSAHFRAIPIDQAIADLGKEDFGLETTADAVGYVASSWSAHVRSWTAKSDTAILIARYEDMLEKPLATFSAIAHHILMPHTAEQLRQAIDLSSFERLQRTEQRLGFLEKREETAIFFRQGRAGQWREVLTPAQVDRIVSTHGEQMARFGYLPD
jgi:Sulfotransferase domain